MYKKSLKKSVPHLRTGTIVIGLAFFQTVTFLLLHDLFIDLATAVGASNRVRGGVGWGVTIYWSTFIFAGICLVNGFLSLYRVPRLRLDFALLGFGLFSLLFVQDVFHLTAWVYPKRALVVVASAFVAMTFPHLLVSLFKKVDANFRNKTPRRASNRLIESR